MPSSRRQFLAGAICVGSASLAGCGSFTGERVTEEIEASESIPDGAAVSVETSNGDVSVRSHGNDRTLHVTGEKSVRGERSDLDRVSVEIDPGVETTVRAEIEDAGLFGGGGACDLEVSVPDGATVDTAATQNGTVDVRNVTGDLTGRAGNGAVTIRDVAGYVAATVSNGRATVRDTTGVREVTSDNGAVDVDVHDIREDVLVSTENGDVTVGAGPELACRVVLSTSIGDVDTRDVSIDVAEQSEERLVGSLNDATAPELEASTTTGDVLLRSARGSPP